MLLEAQLAALRWAVKAKAEAFMDSVRQAIAGAPDGRDGSRHRQTAEMPWPELVKSERRVSLRESRRRRRPPISRDPHGLPHTTDAR